MPKLADRTFTMPSSPIRKLVDYALQAEKRGVKVHYLNIGQPDVESPDAFWNFIRTTEMRTLEYSNSGGIGSLREAAAEHYRSRGIDVRPDEILITNGGSEATLFALLCLFNPGDEVLVVEPFYANYAGFAAAGDVKLVPLTTRIENSFALPTAEEIAAKITPRTRGILLCNPGNPTGTVFGNAELHQIGDLCEKHDLFLIGDEVYRDFYFGSEPLDSVLNLPINPNRVVMLDSASKKFSLCGARVGFFVSRNPEIMQAALKFGQARLSAPTLEMMGVEIALRTTPESYFRDVRDEYIRRRDTLVARLKTIPGVVVPEVNGAFYAVVQLPVADTDAFCQWLVSEFSHEGETVLFAPASGFYITPGLGKQEIRIAYVLDESRIHRAMNVLEAALNVYPGARA